MMKIPDNLREAIQFVGGRTKLNELFENNIVENKGKLTKESKKLIRIALKEKKFVPLLLENDWEEEDKKQKIQDAKYVKPDPLMLRVPVTKTEAIEMFKGKSSFCRAVGISLQSLAFWNETLTKNAQDRIELAMIKKRQQLEREKKD